MTGFILVDGNSLGHAMHNGTTLHVGTFETQAVFGFVKAIRDLIVRMPDRRLVVLWDGKAEWRYAIHPEYKGNRKARTPEQAAKSAAYKAQVPFIQASLERLCIEQKLNYKVEADDLAGYLTPKLAAKGPVLLVTGDGDWKQLIGPNVTWHDPRHDLTVTEANFFDNTGYKTPGSFLDGKCLTGDTSDNIPGVGGIGEQKAPEFIAEFGSVAGFLAIVDEGTYEPRARKSAKAKSLHPEQFLASPEGRQVYERNLKLMNLLEAPHPSPEHQHVFRREFSSEGFKAICSRLAFISIIRDFNNFVRPFAERAGEYAKAA
jgi:DNA polymerase-1